MTRRPGMHGRDHGGLDEAAESRHALSFTFTNIKPSARGPVPGCPLRDWWGPQSFRIRAREARTSVVTWSSLSYRTCHWLPGPSPSVLDSGFHDGTPDHTPAWLCAFGGFQSPSGQDQAVHAGSGDPPDPGTSSPPPGASGPLHVLHCACEPPARSHVRVCSFQMTRALMALTLVS